MTCHKMNAATDEDEPYVVASIPRGATILLICPNGKVKSFKASERLVVVRGDWPIADPDDEWLDWA